MINGYNNGFNSSPDNPPIIQQGIQYRYDGDKTYGDHIQNTGCICNTSASHTYGNVLAVIEQFILRTFPNNVFHTSTFNTKLSSRKLIHLPSALRKLDTPIMAMAPRIVFGQGENRFLGNTRLNDYYTNMHEMWGDGSLLPLGSDNHKSLYVNGHYQRAVLYIDVIMSFDTYHEQINWLSYIYNMFAVGHNKFITTPLELYIPYGFCKLISHLADIPIEDKNKSVYDFNNYMNTLWDYPITYKLKGGSNKNEFFMYYITDIDTLIQEPTYGEGIRDQQIQRGYDISFTIRCEFNTIGYFTLKHPQLADTIHITDEDDPSTAVVPLFSDYINLKDYDLPIGWKVLSWPIFKLDRGENSISIENLLNDSIKTMIDYHLKMGLPMDEFIKIEFRENGSILNNEMYYIDWANRKLTLLHPDYHRTYRLIITVSPLYINETLKKVYNLE